jgi:sterol-4alpha-carboxylate 3-dehydrogenase (decarboxylating)
LTATRTQLNERKKERKKERTKAPSVMTDNTLTVIITGGAGCIGFATIQALLAQHANASIHVLDITAPAQTSNHNVSYHKVDITNAPALLALFQSIKPTAVIHTASIIPSAARKQHLSSERLWAVNVTGAQNVLSAAEQAGAQALVYTSSCDAVKPDSWMDFAHANERETAHLRDAEKWDSEYPRTKVPLPSTA